MCEVWKSIPGHPDYEASTFGRIRSIDRFVSYSASATNPAYTKWTKGRVLKPAPKPSGHLSVVLGRSGGSKDVHRLVALTFYGPCPEGHETLHLDENPTNNQVANLKWGSRSENLIRCWAAGNRTVHPNFIGARWRV